MRPRSNPAAYRLTRPGRKSTQAIERLLRRSRSSNDRDVTYTGRVGNLSIIDDRSWLWLSSLPPRVFGSRALLFDVGASTWSQGGWHGDAHSARLGPCCNEDGQSLHWLWDTYERLGVSFHHAWAWEATQYTEADIWRARLGF